jgi:small-conductance mechanosensitive channel
MSRGSMEPRRRSEAVNVGRVRPVSRIANVEEQDRMTRFDRRLDRDSESRHFVRLREVERQTREELAEIAGEGAITVGEIETERKVLTEMKHELRRAHEESHLMAGDDFELQTWFQQLDASWYRSLRLRGLG